MGKKARLTFRKKYKIKRQLRRKWRLLDHDAQTETPGLEESAEDGKSSTTPCSSVADPGDDEGSTSSPQPQWDDSAITDVQKGGVVYSQVTCHTSQRTREYRTGEFVIIKVDRRVPPMLLHIQCVVQDRDGVSGQVRGLLYARPDDTPHKRQHYHGEHELLVFHKPVALTCEQLFKMEQPDAEWEVGLPLGPPPPSPPSSTASSSGSHTSSTVALYCNEALETEDHSSVSSSSLSPAPEGAFSKVRVMMVTFSQYCRYRAVLKRFGSSAYALMNQPLVQAMGGLRVQHSTLLVFARKTFRDMTLERKLGFGDSFSNYSHLMKRSNTKCDFSNKRSSDGLGLPISKRSRGRPPKNHHLLHKSLLASSSSIIKRKRLKLMSPSHPSRSYYSSSSSSVLHANKPVKRSTISGGGHRLRNRADIQRPVYFRDSFFALEDAIIYNKQHKKHKEKKMKVTNTQQPPSATRHTKPAAPVKSARVLPEDQKHTSAPSVAAVTPPHVAAPPQSPPPPSTTPPPSSPPPSSQESNPTCVEKPHSSSSPSPSSTQDSSGVQQFSIQPHSSIAPQYSTQAHSPHFSAQPHSSNVPHTSMPNLDKYLVSEKSFMELLRCFMRMMNTPVGHLPKLGSKQLNLYQLYKITSNLGGYEVVTSRCMWEHVHEKLGHGPVCSPGATKQYYQEYLGPFERALKAMKSST